MGGKWTFSNLLIVVLCGGPGGMTRELGGLLGMVPYDGPPSSLYWSKNEEWQTFKEALTQHFPHTFRPPAYGNLPLTDQDLIEFLKMHALGGPKWPDNGLTLKENCQLFQETNIEKAVDLIIHGFNRLFNSTEPELES